MLPTLAGPEIGVASTKAFTTQLTVLACLAIAAAARGAIDAEREARWRRAHRGAGAREEVLNHDEAIRAIAAELAEARDVLYLGRGIMYPDRHGRRAQAEGDLLHPRRGLRRRRDEARPDRECRQTTTTGPTIRDPTTFAKQPVTDAELLHHPYVRRLYDWWIAANDGAAPARSQFDIAEHTMLASNIFLVERVDTESFRFKLHGEAAMDIAGMRGAPAEVSERTEDQFNSALFRYYTDLVKNRIPVRCAGSLAFADQPHRRFESIDCPLTDDDGRHGLHHRRDRGAALNLRTPSSGPCGPPSPRGRRAPKKPSPQGERGWGEGSRSSRSAHSPRRLFHVRHVAGVFQNVNADLGRQGRRHGRAACPRRPRSPGQARPGRPGGRAAPGPGRRPERRHRPARPARRRRRPGV